MTGAELWKLFDEECAARGFSALLFGDYDSRGRLLPEDQRRRIPEDLTLWNNIAERITKGA
jgi:hypothetical protein